MRGKRLSVAEVLQLADGVKLVVNRTGLLWEELKGDSLEIIEISEDAEIAKTVDKDGLYDYVEEEEGYELEYYEYKED